MWRVIGYWVALSLVTAAGWALLKGVNRAFAQDYMRRDRIEPAENHDELIERMSLLRQREAATEVSEL